MHSSPSLDDPPTDVATLEAEGRWLHRCVFGSAISEATLARYVAAHRHLDLARDVDVAKVVRLKLDAEAIELFARRRHPRNVLTQKLRTLLYLVEIDARYYDLFVRHQGTLWSCLAWFVVCPIRSAWKLLKGRWQALRYDVV